MNSTQPDSYAAFSNQLLRELADSLCLPCLMPGEYDNPFNILDEVDQWFEFEKRKRFDKEPTRTILEDMLAHDLARAANALNTNYTMMQFRCFSDFGRMRIGTR